MKPRQVFYLKLKYYEPENKHPIVVYMRKEFDDSERRNDWVEQFLSVIIIYQQKRHIGARKATLQLQDSFWSPQKGQRIFKIQNGLGILVHDVLKFGRNTN